jgi:hypothetical protein
MGKAQFISTLNWESTNPATTFLPIPGPGSTVARNSKPLSGVTAGVVSSTNTIYSNIIGLQQMDVSGIEVAWTGTPTGTISVLVSVSGINWPALSGFNPAITQPSGSAGSTFIQLSPIGAAAFYLQYTNASGSGTISAYLQCKAYNS